MLFLHLVTEGAIIQPVTAASNQRSRQRLLKIKNE